MPDKALAGTKVLEYAQFVAGPYCAKLMADLGAEVIKIEPPNGDVARRRGPFPNDIPHPERSGLFLYNNTNKSGITLNLDSTEGKEIFKRLIKDIDIFVEDTPPGMMKKLGLDYAALKEMNPRLIMTSITPFGQTGPYKDYKAYYLNLSHGSGLGYLTPFTPLDPHILEREPTREGGFFGEYTCGLFAAIAILSALYSRRFTGEGQYIDVSKQEELLHMQRAEMAGYFEDGHSNHRTDLLVFAAYPFLYPCKDGHVVLVAAEDHQWQALADLMGNPEWTKEERFGPEKRRNHMVEVYEMTSAWTPEHTRDEIYHGLQKRRCPASPIYKVGEVPHTEHMKARGSFVDLKHPEAGRLSYPSGLAKFSKSPVVFDRPAPLLGEHNQETYCKRLGYSPQELSRLRETGVI